jgi:hypothetical protein
MYKPAVEGMVKFVVVEIVKFVAGSVRWYWKVPFCSVSQLFVGVVRVPAIEQFNEVACEVPLFTVTDPKMVKGVPTVFVILAEVLPLKITGTFTRFTLEVV